MIALRSQILNNNCLKIHTKREAHEILDACLVDRKERVTPVIARQEGC